MLETDKIRSIQNKKKRGFCYQIEKSNLGLNRLKEDLMARKTRNFSRSLGDAISMATSFVAAIALGYFAGDYLDTRFGTEPWLMLLSLLLGLVTGLKIIYDKAVKKGGFGNVLEKDEDTETRDYAPSKEIITALDEAKQRLAELDKSGKEDRDSGQK